MAVHFTPPSPPDTIESGDWFPDYTPDQAGLVVLHLHGRWLAGWTMLEEAGSDLPESRRHELVRVLPDPTAPYGVTFHEV